jgi:pimeloyl-ACP methyl ester carboxylesterase
VSRTSERTSRAEQIDLHLPGFALAALQTGDPTNPPVLLVPGWTGSKEDFGPILDSLGEAGFWVTAIDQRGQFRSPFRPDGDYSCAALGSDLRLAARALGGAVHLAGHSFGGLVARAAVLDEPALFRSLVLLDSGPAGLDGGRKERLDLMRPVLAQYGLAAVYEALIQLDASQPGYVAPSAEEARFMRERFLANDPGALVGMAEALIGEPDLVRELASTGVPVLVAHGTDDDAWSPDIQGEMAQRLGAQHTIVPDSAHSPAVENPEETTTALVEFWRSAENHG